jgi:hypothetical protein
MLDTDTFLTIVYVLADDFASAELPPEPAYGRPPALCRSEALALGLLSQWGRWASQRDFYRFAHQRLRPLFPHLPARAQFNRLLRKHYSAFVCFAQHLVHLLGADQATYEALDGTALPQRNVKRRGRGWFCGQANIGYSPRIGWYDGFHLLTAISPEGVITGWGRAPASTKDQTHAESFFALRAAPQVGYEGVGPKPPGWYLADRGFAGRDAVRRWQEGYGAAVVCAPPKDSKVRWPKPLRQWLAGHRQIVETVNDKLHNWFHLQNARQHTLSGVHTKLAATAAMHNCMMWLNREAGRPLLAFADLLDW